MARCPGLKLSVDVKCITGTPKGPQPMASVSDHLLLEHLSSVLEHSVLSKACENKAINKKKKRNKINPNPQLLQAAGVRNGGSLSTTTVISF